MSTPLPLKRRLLEWRTLASFVLALAFIVFLLFRLEVNLGSVWTRIRESNPWLYLLAFIVYYTGFPLRAWRWHILLRNAGVTGFLPSPWRLTPVILLNWFANCITYARLGDAYRAYLLKEETKGGFALPLGTVVAERVVDLAVIVSLLLLAATGLWGVEWRPLLGLGLGLLALMALGLLLLARLKESFRRRLPGKLGGIFAGLQQGILGSFRSLPLVFALTVTIWLTEAGRLALVTIALGASVSPLLLLVVSLAGGLLSALPFTPGGLGLVEPGVAGVLMTALPEEQAWSITLLDRTINFLSLIVVGFLLLLLREALRLRGASRRDSNKF